MSHTKAQTLHTIKEKLSRFKIPQFIYFKTGEWEGQKEELTRKIEKKFQGDLLAIRSSAADEDGAHTSLAGEYESVLNVPSKDPDALEKAIETVQSSYQKNGKRGGDDEIIVQEMLENTVMSGVVFTYDLNTGAPYYVINYDDISGKTDTVTSGNGDYANRTLYIHRGATEALRSERFQQLTAAVRELEKVMDSQFLDIEFAMDKNLVPYLFQVRAITTQPNWNRAVARRIDASLEGIQRFVRTRFRPVQGVYGDSTVLGQMPDWNPAEMIGRAPRRLACSLYETLITNNAWRTAREEMGYKVPTGQPLMVSLAGQPFIDTRLSFHSYLPGDLPVEISQKLVNRWVERLRENPEYHDKVEFDVAITAFSFDIDEKMESLLGDTLAENEKQLFRETLRKLTIGLMAEDAKGGVEEALKRIHFLEEKQGEYNLGKETSDLNLLFAMMDDCIRLGTVPFSILARHGFIARTLMLSLSERGILSKEEIQEFQAGIRTVAGELVDDMVRLQTGEKTRPEFMEKYGHLRPGTYDILSTRYDQIENFGSGESRLDPDHPEPPEFELTSSQRNAIDRLLEEEGFKKTGLNTERFFDYLKSATAGREYGKFIFTRSVSDMLELIASFGENNGLSRDELSHISVNDIVEVARSSGEEIVEDRLRELAEEGAEHHTVSSAIRLPQVLYDEEGVHVVPFQVSHPNFITDKRITADSVRLAVNSGELSIEGQIVLIESADPGFDWIFAHNIAGLVTKYGGANSHMAIRCAEFGIPAAIGCGEQRFDLLSKAEQILLDCTAGLIQTQL